MPTPDLAQGRGQQRLAGGDAGQQRRAAAPRSRPRPGSATPQQSVSQTGSWTARWPVSRSSTADLGQAEPLAAVRLGHRQRRAARRRRAPRPRPSPRRRSAARSSASRTTERTASTDSAVWRSRNLRHVHLLRPSRVRTERQNCNLFYLSPTRSSRVRVTRCACRPRWRCSMPPAGLRALRADPRGPAWSSCPAAGSTYVTDTPGPSPDSPTIVLLHAVGCTGLLTWFPAIEPLSRRFRVVTLDQRWHGRGIQSEEFSLYDCADDVAALIDVLGLDDVIVAGYSMGSIVAQRVWRQHPDKCRGPGALRDHRPLPARPIAERLLPRRDGASRCSAPAGCPARASRCAARVRRPRRSTSSPTTSTTGRSRSSAAPAPGPSARPSPRSAATTRGRGSPASTCRPPWSSPSRTTCSRRDNQIALARRIPGATIHDIKAGHAACVLQSERFVPALLEAVTTVNARRRDFSGRRRPSSSLLA